MSNSHIEDNKRIAKNTIMLYIRMLFGMLVSFYTSRVILNALGAEDYGIQNVVGGFVAMFSLISGSLSSSVSRFLTFELGKNSAKGLSIVFSTSVLIHIILSGIILLLTETIGVWFVNNEMVIPENRLYAANWVFQASIVSFIFGLLSIPYNALIVAHEHMSAFAYVGIVEIMLKLGIVLFVAYAPFTFDKLIVYSWLLMVLGVIMRFVYVSYCHRHFKESRVWWRFDKKCWHEMGAFAGWNFIGCTAGLLKGQGVDILINLFFGPVVNAARGIAGNVSGAVGSFAGNFIAALNPQITKSYAANDKDYTYSIVERGSRFSCYLMFLLALPIFLEIEFVLTLWLKQYPEYTVDFVRLVLILSLCDIVSNTLITLQSATGKIRNYQIAVGGMLLMNFPLSYICLKLGCSPESTLIVAIFVSICCLILRLLFLRKMAGLSMRRFVKNVCVRIMIVVVISSIIPFVIHASMDYGWLRFIAVGTAAEISSGMTILFLGCSKGERTFIINKLISFKSKFVN